MAEFSFAPSSIIRRILYKPFLDSKNRLYFMIKPMAQTALSTEGSNVFPLILFLLPLLSHPQPSETKVCCSSTGSISMANHRQHSPDRKTAPHSYGRLGTILWSSLLTTTWNSTLVVASSPAAAKELLSSYDRILCGRSVLRVLAEKSSEFCSNTVGGSLECDDKWKYLRTMCRSKLFSGKAIESPACYREKKVMEVVRFLSSM